MTCGGCDYERMFYVTASKLGTWILEQMNLRGWTQNDLADRVGVTRSQISSIVTGRRGPSNELLIELSRAFRVSQEEVFRVAGLIPDKSKDKRSEFLVSRIMSLPESDQDIVEAFIDTMLERNEKKVDLKRKAIDS